MKNFDFLERHSHHDFGFLSDPDSDGESWGSWKGIGSMDKGRDEGKHWVVKVDSNGKGGTAVGQKAGDICTHRFGLGALG